MWLAQVGYDRLDESKQVAKRGGKITQNARLDYNQELGVKVVSEINAKTRIY